ncbi:MAG: hypothetical protein WCK67_06615 [bacterium]
MVYGIQNQDLFNKINNFSLNLQNNGTVNNNNGLELLFNNTNVAANTDDVNFTTKTGNAATDNLKEQVAAKKAQKEVVENEMQAKQDELTKLISETDDLSKALTAKQENQVQEAVKKVTTKTQNDPSIKFNDALKAELAGIGIDTSILDSKVQTANALGLTIQNLSQEAATLGTDIQGLETQIKTAEAQQAKQAAFTGDVNTSANPEVAALQQFLASPQAKNMTEDQFKKYIGANFSNAIKVDNNGNVQVPNGHDTESTQVFSDLCVELQKKAPDTQIERTDPIGFKADGWKFDFINDKNKDGKFSGKEEFLGAQNGWDELLQFDTNKDGIIDGKELNALQTLATKDGQSKIASAADLGINSIDLNSFSKKNELDVNNNILAGTFNVDYKGKNVEGQQTLDTNEFLNKTYGNVFGMNINATEAAAKTAEAQGAPTVKSFIENVLKNFKNNVEEEKDAMKKMKESYLLYA